MTDYEFDRLFPGAIPVRDRHDFVADRLLAVAFRLWFPLAAGAAVRILKFVLS